MLYVRHLESYQISIYYILFEKDFLVTRTLCGKYWSGSCWCIATLGRGGGGGGGWWRAEPAIEDWVTAGGQHRHQVEYEEHQVVVGPTQELHLHIKTTTTGSDLPCYISPTTHTFYFTSKSSARLMMFIGNQQMVKANSMQRSMKLLYLKL